MCCIELFVTVSIMWQAARRWQIMRKYHTYSKEGRNVVHIKHRIFRFELIPSPVASARVLCVCLCVCVCVCIYIYIYIYTHTHAHTHPHNNCADFTKPTESWCVDLLTEVGKWRCFVPSARGGNIYTV